MTVSSVASGRALELGADRQWAQDRLDPLALACGEPGRHLDQRERVALGRVDEPVAAGQLEVRAARRARAQGDELAPPRLEPEVGAAAQADGVLEEDELSAGVAGEGAHGRARVAAAISAPAPTA